MLENPGGRQSAPQPLATVQAFVNTVDIENGVEELVGPGELTEILVRIGVLDPNEPAADECAFARAFRFREALRSLLLANNGGRADAGALQTLERVSRDARLELRFHDGRSALVPQAEGVDGALGRIAAVVHDAMVAGTWKRLKACPRDVCLWAFYDRSKNVSSRWCAMSVCGNRTKTRTYRRRHSRA